MEPLQLIPYGAGKAISLALKQISGQGVWKSLKSSRMRKKVMGFYLHNTFYCRCFTHPSLETSSSKIFLLKLLNLYFLTDDQPLDKNAQGIPLIQILLNIMNKNIFSLKCKSGLSWPS